MGKIIISLGFCLCMVSAVLAQLPNDYITKVTYEEQKQVSFEMFGENGEAIIQALQSGGDYPPSPNGVDCLTLGELSRYHGYRQDITMTQYIDMDGELLTDKVFTYEENVRDKWMKPYSRVVLGKKLYEIYGEGDQLLYRYTKEQLGDSLNAEVPNYMNAEDAANFQHYVLDQNFYRSAVDELRNLEDQPDSLFDRDGVLVAHFDSFTYLYDHQIKMFVYTEYDWYRVNKKKETVALYKLTDDAGGYAPFQEITSEWFRTENGCCIRKMTVVLRDRFRREVNEAYVRFVKPLGPDQVGSTRREEEEYRISTVPGSAGFMVQSKQHKGETLHIAIYDLTGKLLAKQDITEGMPVKFPAVRASLYLVEVLSEDGTRKLVRQVIKPDSGNTF